MTYWSYLQGHHSYTFVIHQLGRDHRGRFRIQHVVQSLWEFWIQEQTTHLGDSLVRTTRKNLQLVSVHQDGALAVEVTKATKHLLKQVEGVPALFAESGVVMMGGGVGV
jgi:hypothetical protein